MATTRPVSHAMTATAVTLDGYRSTKTLGVVKGITVRSRSVFGTMGAALQTLAGGNIMGRRATGPFEVKLNPQPAYNTDETALLGRMSIDKQFHGDLEAMSRGEMLTAGSAVKGSAAYVAIERVSGTLDGKTGSFALQHTGIMNRGAPSLVITVVPDSGVGGLEGLTGTMSIEIVNGKHSYVLDYALPGGR